MAKLIILSKKGDEGIEFSPTNFAEAQKVFQQLLAGKDSFAFASVGGETRVIRDFNPLADEITIAKRIIGG